VTKKLTVSLALRATPRVRPLLTGAVEPVGVELIAQEVAPADVFWRQLRFGDFDVSEMSMSSLAMAVEQGDDRWAALPVFPDRRFFHAGILVREGAGVERPQDLAGRRVGVPDYQQTAALWGRGALLHEFGVAPQDITWFMERSPELSHGGATSFAPPDGVTIHRIPAGSSQHEMLLSGELDASLWYIRYATLLDRSAGAEFPPGTVRMLFPDVAAEQARYFGVTGFVPMNHCVVVRRALLERHPWVAINLYQAFVAAKEAGRAAVREALELPLQAGVLDPAAAEAALTDLFPYGVAANRDALETLLAYSREQGLTRGGVTLEALFAESVLDL